MEIPTLFLMINPASIGLTIPGTVAHVLEIASIMLAYWGAISKGFTLENKNTVSVDQKYFFTICKKNLPESTPSKCTKPNSKC